VSKKKQEPTKKNLKKKLVLTLKTFYIASRVVIFAGLFKGL